MSTKIDQVEKLAINGGTPVCTRESMLQKGFIGKEEMDAAIMLFKEAISSGNAFGYNGPAEKQYEKNFADFMGGGFANGVNSGTNAIFCAIGALRLDAFSEIIVSPITDGGGIMPIVFAGCVPIVADADPRTYNTCAKEIEKMITPRTKAILVAHIGGEPVDMDPVIELARKHELYVIEDCAQSHGAEYKDRKVGTIGDIAGFSTMFCKHHCTGGQGGLVYTHNETLYWNAKRFADRGKPFNLPEESGNVVAGLNCNLNDLSATIGSVQIKKLPEFLKKRRFVGEYVKQELQKKSKSLSLGWQIEGCKSAYWFLRLKIDIGKLQTDKETFCQALEAEGMLVDPAYYHIPCTMPWFKEKSVFGNSGFPWDCVEYKGEKKPKFKIENAEKAIKEHFNI